MVNAPVKLVTKKGRKVNVRPDTLDFRDRMFEPTLVEVPTAIELGDYMKKRIPVLDQGTEGACTGFGLATVVNYLLRTRKTAPDKTEVSPWLLYHLAKRYDEWPGEKYEGSSARGAMKGWHKHGVCSRRLFSDGKGQLTPQAARDATTRPLGAYYRVNHKDLVAMHSAFAEVGILYATASVHEGWDNVKSDGVIKFSEHTLGGHAFAIVAYDEEGFWIQNSWGAGWGRKGFGHISYDDWLASANDVWVARLGVPVSLQAPATVAARHAASIPSTDPLGNFELRRHIISLGNDGLLSPAGTYGTDEEQVKNIFGEYFSTATRGWKKKRILLYAHGGLVDEAAAVQRLADYRPALLASEVYPVSFIWHTDFWSTVTNILQDAVKRRRPEGFLDAAKDFMLDRLDDGLEPFARLLGGKGMWDEMKENAGGASQAGGGAALAAGHLRKLIAQDPSIEIHIAGHSAGSIFHGHLIKLLAGSEYRIPIRTCTLWAPACTTRLFKEAYLPAIAAGKIGQFSLFTLTDKAEQDDNCGRVYNKSLLYLVSHAFEEKQRIPLFRDGEPLLGMAKCIDADSELRRLFAEGTADWVQAPNNESDPRRASTARHHGDFDDDAQTVKATLARILGDGKAAGSIQFHRSAATMRERRRRL